MGEKRRLKFGIFGNGVCHRGGMFATNILSCGADVVAFCDADPDKFERMRQKVEQCGGGELRCYTDFDEFIKDDFDAVVLCNYFNEHAPYAIKALYAGKHVFTECTSNVTMAQGVALCRAVEETGKVFSLFENYTCFKSNMEMEKLYKGGTLGKLVYGEGCYAHPMSPEEQIGVSPGLHHWRNYESKAIYCTHALCPVLQMTDSLPKRVVAMAGFAPETSDGSACRSGDGAAIIMIQTDTDAVIRATGWANYMPSGNEYKLCCTRGGVFSDGSELKVQYASWSKPEGVEQEKFSTIPKWPDEELGKLADNSGHDGGDFWAVYRFIKDLEEGREPYWNVYRSTMVASVGILAWRSILQNNQSFDIPDFRKEEDRRKYEFDNISHYPDENGNVDIPCSSKPYTPTEEGIRKTLERFPEKVHIKRIK